MGISPGWFNFFIPLCETREIKRGDAMLDIGASELFCTEDPGRLNDLIRTLAGEPYRPDELATAANRSFAGDFFRRAGLRYAAIDYANYPGIIRRDLNLEGLPEEHHGQYRFVANSGTSEHILNQYNVFKVIHDAAAPGGIMYHGVPGWGDYEHGIIEYSPKFFWALATANDYEIMQFWGWSDGKPAELKPDFMREIRFARAPVCERVWLHILLRKRKAAPFRGLNDPVFSADATQPG